MKKLRCNKYQKVNIMSKIDDLLEGIREHKKKFDITEQSSAADKLRYEIMKNGKSEEEWFEL